MPRESNLEFKVGIFVVFAFVLLTIFIFSVTDASFLKEGKIVTVVFEFANGLKKSAPVRVAGVDQGMVKEITLFFDGEDNKTKARVDLWLDKEINIPQDSLITINQLGLLGEKYVEIIPGTDRRQFIASGSVLKGKDPIAQEQISARVMDVASQLEATISGFNRLVNDEQAFHSISVAVSNLSDLTQGISDIVNDLKQGKGTFGKLVTEDELYDDIHRLAADMRDISSSIRSERGLVGKFIYDDELYRNLVEISADLKENPWKLFYREKK